MTGWLPIDTPPIHADVVRWTEPVFYYPKSKRSKPKRIGSREITAEVLKVEGEWAVLLVADCKKITEDTLRDVEILKPKVEIKRKMPTLMRNKPERMAWSDEDARKEVISSLFKFMS